MSFLHDTGAFLTCVVNQLAQLYLSSVNTEAYFSAVQTTSSPEFTFFLPRERILVAGGHVSTQGKEHRREGGSSTLFCLVGGRDKSRVLFQNGAYVPE